VLKTTVAPGESPTDLSPIVIHEIELIGSRCGPFETALAALAEEKVDVVSLISRRLRLRDGEEALRVAREKDVIKVLMTP